VTVCNVERFIVRVSVIPLKVVKISLMTLESTAGTFAAHQFLTHHESPGTLVFPLVAISSSVFEAMFVEVVPLALVFGRVASH
jgi:hypothetical protein